MYPPTEQTAPQTRPRPRPRRRPAQQSAPQGTTPARGAYNRGHGKSPNPGPSTRGTHQRGRGSQVVPDRAGEVTSLSERGLWNTPNEETDNNFNSAAFWRRVREKANARSQTRRYGSLPSGQHQYRYCMKCGESNHETANCFHKEAIECNNCHMPGHKNKWCKYYNWRVGQGRCSELRHTEAENDSSSFTSNNVNFGVVQSSYEHLTFGHLNLRSLLPKIDEIRNFMSVSNFDIFAVSESWLNDTIIDSEIAIEGYQVYRKDRSNSIGGGVCLYVNKSAKGAGVYLTLAEVTG